MTAEFVVFLGPTLNPDEARRNLRALYLPPAEQGNIFDVAQTIKPSIIVLIDGAFASVPAVRHKEILWARSRGVEVWGAASIGAIRAAELNGFGMNGAGFIYRWFRATPFADDDEVAVAMMPTELGSHALSEALINIRLTLRRAQREKLIDADTRRSIVEMARSTHFVDCTYTLLFEKARRTLSSRQAHLMDDLIPWTEKNAIDQKRSDAVALLQRLASIDGSEQKLDRARVPFQVTEAWAADLDAAGLYSDDLLPNENS
jgi:hypothetical protein